MTSGRLADRFAGSYATRDMQPELPSITAPIVAWPEYAPANLAEQGWPGKIAAKSTVRATRWACPNAAREPFGMHRRCRVARISERCASGWAPAQAIRPDALRSPRMVPATAQS